MMQRLHLTQWQAAHAPWPKASQVEQDLRIARGVAAIFSDNILREYLAMRGGTVLHKGHLAPAARYSEDIDLVLTKKMRIPVLEGHLRRVLAPVLGVPEKSLVDSVLLTIRNVLRPLQILRIAYKFTPLELRYPETIKVEVNLNESKSLYPLVDVGVASLDEEGGEVKVKARSYDINEMLGTKTRALVQREQGRDLFDLAHALNLSEAGATPYRVDGLKAMKAFAWYLEMEGTRMTEAEANAHSQCAS
jgi:predicted nucleotidyltransferase component of viral defense system